MKKTEIIENIKSILTELISFPTYYKNDQAFIDLFEYIKTNIKDNLFVEEKIINYDNHDNYNLIISNTQSKDLDLIFCCHVDVIPDRKYAAVIKDNKLYGRGAIDMKGQIAVILELLKNENSSKKIALILTSDEEVGGFCCKEIIKDYQSKLAILPDGGNNFDLIIEEKGVLQLEITSKGISSHGSEPFNGDNAIVKLIKLYGDLITKYPIPNNNNEFKLSITLSKLHGGDANNKVPDKAIMNLDIRYTKEDNIEEFIKYIKNYSKDISVKILDLEPVFYVDKDNPLIKDFINNCSIILGKEPNITKCCAGSDAPYFKEKEIPVIIMNPKGKNWHSPNEYVEIDSLYTLYEIFKTML